MRRSTTLLCLLLLASACSKRDEKKIEKALDQAGQKAEQAGQAAQRQASRAGDALLANLDKLVKQLQEKAAAAKKGNLQAATELKETSQQASEALKAAEAIKDQLTPEQQQQLTKLQETLKELGK